MSVLLKGAKRNDLTDEIASSNAEIRRQEERRNRAQKALDTLNATGEKYVGENEDKKEAREKQDDGTEPESVSAA